MEKVNILMNNSNAEGSKTDLPNVEIVKKKENRSEFNVKSDKAAEICSKTPRSIPINEKQK